jgi:histidine triad (HIT) family protein
MEDCLFCKIVAGDIPSTVVYQDEDVFAFRDINPQAPQHILIIPKCHIPSIVELTLEDGPILARLFMVTNKIAQDLQLERGYRVVTNVGKDAGQSVLHLHFHLLGGRALKWPPG